MIVVVLLAFAFLCSAGQIKAEGQVDLVKEGRLLGALLEGNFVGDGCTCSKNSCSCCKAVTWQSITKTICGDITYTSQSKQFSIALSADKTPLMNLQVTVDNPKACKDVTVQGHTVNVCAEIANIKTESADISGCLNLAVTMMQTYNVDLGCFKMPYSMNGKLLFWGNNGK
ncbi:uncharacterized protein LOC133205613 [Saccostrea echinata]|uniref:uncharacterized protein LOC133205613 n=1 Tax=Saccostrea echinata TaxID=191078 RepID=UPI002A83D0CB|nr:uncharacterized protein LOC133205613 [Saccostrea echinata]